MLFLPVFSYCYKFCNAHDECLRSFTNSLVHLYECNFDIFRFILLKNSGEEVMIRDHKRIGQFVLARHFLGQSHKQFMMSLDLTQHIEDIEDKILMFSTGHTKNHTLHIHRPQTNNPLKFAVCVKPFYGTFPDKYIPRLIEWFEINRLFGISEFHFYNATMKETLYFNRVLTHYKHFVHIHQFGAGFAVKSDTEEFEAAEVLTRAALSDCIYRNYNRLEYLLVIDIDEMIIPRYHQDYTSLINTLNLSSDPYDQPSSILFVMSMFYSVYGQDDSQPDYLHTMKYRSRIIYDNGQLRNLATSAKRTKSFINIKTCVLAFHHYCRVPISNNTEMFMLVPSSVAMLHHYRDEFKWRRVTLKETPSRDDVMLQYKQYLEKPVWEVIKEVMY